MAYTITLNSATATSLNITTTVSSASTGYNGFYETITLYNNATNEVVDEKTSQKNISSWKIYNNSYNYVFDKLDPGVTYRVESSCDCYKDATGTWYEIIETFAVFTTTAIDENYIPNFSYVTILQDYEKSTHTSVAFCVENLDEYFTGIWDITISIDGSKSQSVKGSGERTRTIIFSDLSPSTIYTVNIDIKYKVNKVEMVNPTITGYVSTKDDPDLYNVYLGDINIGLISATTTSMTFDVYGLDENYEHSYGWKITPSLYYAENDRRVVMLNTITVPAGSSGSPTFIFTNLDPYTHYYVKCTIGYMLFGSTEYHDVKTLGSFCPIDYVDSEELVTEPDCSNVYIAKAISSSLESLWLYVAGLDENYRGTWTFSWRLYYQGVRIDSGSTSEVGGDNRSEEVEFDNLIAGENYVVEVTIQYTYNGTTVTYGTIRKDIVTDGTSIDMSAASIVATSSTDGKSISAYVKNMGVGYDDGVASIRWYLDSVSGNMYGETLVYDTSDSDSFTFNYGISPSTSYVIHAVIVYYNVGYEYTHPISIQITTGTFIGNATIVCSESTENSISVYITGLDENYSSSDRYIYWSIDGVEKPRETLAPNVPSSDIYTFSLLNPDTEYTIGARIQYISAGQTLYKTLDSITVSTKKIIPTSWTVRGYSLYSNLTETKSLYVGFSMGDVARIPFSCKYTGTVTIYTEGNTTGGVLDPIGYLSDQSNIYADTGEPVSYLVSADDNNNDASDKNFRFTWNVSAGVTYYIFFRLYDLKQSGTSTIYIVPPVEIQRPDLFSWDSDRPKVKHGDFNLTANEWCRLLNNINDVRKYKKMYEISEGDSIGYFLYPNIGDDFLALHYNQALMAISSIYGDNSGYYNTYKVVPDMDITADCLNLLVELINGV